MLTCSIRDSSTNRIAFCGHTSRSGRILLFLALLRGALTAWGPDAWSLRTTLSNDLLTLMRPLYSMKPSLRKRFMKKLTRDRVVPIISARVSCVIFGIRDSGSPGLPNSAINKRIVSQPLFAGVEQLIDEVRLSTHTAGEEKLQKKV